MKHVPGRSFPAVALRHSDDALDEYVRRIFGMRRQCVLVPDVRVEQDVAVHVDVARDCERFCAGSVGYVNGVADFYIAVFQRRVGDAARVVSYS